MAELKKPKKIQESAHVRWFEGFIDKTNRLKNNRVYALISYIFRKAFWFLLILMVIYYLIVFYGNTAKVDTDDQLKIDAYESVLAELKPATPLIEKQRELLLTEIMMAKSDQKITVSEFVKIQGMYDALEESLMLMVASSIKNQASEKNSNETSKEKGE